MLKLIVLLIAIGIRAQGNGALAPFVKDRALHGTTYEVLEKGKFSKKIQLSLMGWEGA